MKQVPSFLSDGEQHFAEGAVLINSDGSPLALASEPDGTATMPISSIRAIFSDDFGDGAIDLTKWQVLNGGDASHGGSGTMTGMTNSVGSSALTVNMGTVASDELWLMSLQTFSLPVDLTVLLSKSQELAANLVYVELVEVDPVLGTIYDNAAFSGEPRNRISINAGARTLATTTDIEAIGDGSGSLATVTVTTQTRAAAAVVEYMLEARAEDSWLASCSPDVATPKTLQGRLSSQAPNNSKLYKIRLRFKNNGSPATTTAVKIFRVFVADLQEQRVEVTSGRGDIAGGKGIPVNATLQAGVAVAAQFIPTQPAGITASVGGLGLFVNKRISTADTNQVLLRATAVRLMGGCAYNASASVKYLKFFNKTTAPVTGTDTPILNIPIMPGVVINLAPIFSDYGLSQIGIGYAITGGMADLDNTAVAAADVLVNVLYV